MKLADVLTEVAHRWPQNVETRPACTDSSYELCCRAPVLPDICAWLFTEVGYSFSGLIVEEGVAQWELRYVFYGELEMGWIHVITRSSLENKIFPSIVAGVHAADWHEREVEDHFGLIFEGHPRLGDFVFHDDRWQEGLEPMRHGFNAHDAITNRQPNLNWRPLRIVHAPGSFMMPIGPVYAGGAEPVHFLLETVGEDVIRTILRLFYKYRGIEKIAEGQTVEDVLLLAERFCGTSAFAHSLAFSQATETISHLEIPSRAIKLRVLMAELERFHHHVAAIESICESTGLAVAASQTAILQEDLLRLTGTLTGHRYLFGVLCVGGLTRDFSDTDCQEALIRVRKVGLKLEKIEQMLRFTSSFLDRIEQVGVTSHGEALVHGVVGPVARAAGIVRDLRKAQPYCNYEALDFEIPVESEGDGYARLRILFAEAQQSVHLIEQAVATLPAGPVAVPCNLQSGAALGWVEAPRGAAVHWLRIGEDLRGPAVPDYAPFIYELAWISSIGGEFCISGFSHYSGDIRSISGGK